MLKRLMVLAAALAMVLAFASTSSAQTQAPLPPACTGAITNPQSLDDCLNALDAVDAVPDDCTTFLGGALPSLLQLQVPTGDLLRCVAGLTDLGVDFEDDEGDIGEGEDGYGYDEGYDVSYDDGYGDEGDVPEGGVDSGIGPPGSDAPGAPLVARGAALLAMLGVLTTGLVMTRRRPGS